MQCPADFMKRGYLGDEPIGLELIPGYHLEVLHLKNLARISSDWMVADNPCFSRILLSIVDCLVDVRL